MGCGLRVDNSEPGTRNSQPVLLGAFDDFDEAPAFVFAQRARLHDTDGVSLAGIVVLVVGHELRRLFDDLAVGLVRDLPLDPDEDALVHFVADDDADAFFAGVSGFYRVFH